MPSINTCFVICGPTAVGKTSLSIQLAEALSTSIISADSRQCYRELNIGVAKPSPQDLAAVPHYFINSHSIFQEVNAAGFEKYADNAVAEIFTSSESAVMVGGTGLYINAFCEGLDNIPPVDPMIRREVRENYQLKGLEWLRTELSLLDPSYALEGEMSNPQRMMRAMEVIISTGAPIRSYQKAAIKDRPYRIIKVGLELSRDELYIRINERVDQMIAEGLVNEVESLFAHKELNALNTVGYKEIISFLEEKSSLTEAIAAIKQNTRHYAKRQVTWFKKDEEVAWFNPASTQQIIDYCVDIASNSK